MLPEEILRKIGELTSVEAMRNLIATCKYIRNRPNTWFLQLLASENNPDRATSGFIVDAIGNKGNTCLWRNAKFFIKGHNVPKDLSIHLLVNTTAKKISSDEVRSMIIQVSGSLESYIDIQNFLKFLFLKVSFKKLKCLMFCGVELSNEFSQEIESLNLDAFHMRNFLHDTDLTERNFFCYSYSLKTLYVVHPDEDQLICPPVMLNRLVIYCPESSKYIIRRRRDIYGRRDIYYGLGVDVDRCYALKEM